MVLTKITYRRVGVTGLCLFMKATKGHAALAGKVGGARSRALMKLWHALPAAQRELFTSKGAKTAVKVTRRCVSGWTHKPNDYNKFVKAHYKRVMSLPATKRMTALSKLYRKSA